MEKHISGLLMVIAVFALLIGGLVGYNMAPTKVVTETETKIVYQNISVDKIVEVPAIDLLSVSVDTFMQFVDDDEFDGNRTETGILTDYDFDEIEISRIYDKYNVSYDDEITTVNFKVKMRFDEEDEASEKKIFDVTVIFEDNEDTEVEVKLA
jgi:hypothetical protein